MTVRPYGVRISTVASSALPSPNGCVGYQRSATSSTPSGILAVRPRSTDTSVVRGGGSLTTDAAIRLHTVMRDPPVVPPATAPAAAPASATAGAALSPPQAAWSNPNTIES